MDIDKKDLVRFIDKISRTKEKRRSANDSILDAKNKLDILDRTLTSLRNDKVLDELEKELI